MNTTPPPPVLRLERILDRLRRLQQRPLHSEVDLRQALDDCQLLLGALARYRHWLRCIAPPGTWPAPPSPAPEP